MIDFSKLKTPKESDIASKEGEYSESSFWDKLKKYAGKAGCAAVYAALILFYSLRDDNIPAKAKAAVAGALGYFIAPLDLIFDAIPIGGFVDDYTALLIAIGVVAMFVSEETKQKAKQKLFEIMGGACVADDIAEVDAKLGSKKN